MWIGGVKFKTPDICKWCDFLMQCTARLSSDILGMPQLKPSPEEEVLMARMGKVMMLQAEWELTEEEAWEQAMETQRLIFDLG